MRLRIYLLCLLWLPLPLERIAAADSQASPATPQPLYERRAEHDPNGTGTFFLGREIALVMGHEGADWLERPERDREEHTAVLLEALQLKPGQNVADIGAGSGYFTRPMARRVGPSGKVIAVDIQREMLALLRSGLSSAGITNVSTVLGSEKNPNLAPASIDLALLVDVYHEFSQPYEMMAEITRALRPGGRVVLVEYRGEDPNVPIKAVHKMTEAQVRREMALHPLEFLEVNRTLPQQNIFVFRKSDPGE